MSIELTWLGHGSWTMKVGETNVLLDPFLDDNPVASCQAADLVADFILVSHGHFDHVADVAPIANRTSATVIANFETAEWFKAKHGVQNTVGMNLGGGVNLPFGRVIMTTAHHSSQLPDGSYGGNPAGFVVEAAERKVYFACDTALFSDMRLIGESGIDLAVLPIGDLFTMGPADAVLATITSPPIETRTAMTTNLIATELLYIFISSWSARYARPGPPSPMGASLATGKGGVKRPMPD